MKILESEITHQDRAWIKAQAGADFRMDFPWADQGQMWGLKIDGLLVAFIFYRVLPPAAEILSLAVHPSFRRKGFLKQLFGGLVQHLKDELQVSEIWLEVHDNNWAAKGLYETLGFTVNGRRRAYYPDGRDALLMSKNL